MIPQSCVMTLDSQLTCTNKMAVSASPRTNTTSAGSGLSFSISRLLEKATANDNSASAHPLEVKPSATKNNNSSKVTTTAAAEMLMNNHRESPPESPLEVDDDVGENEESDAEDDEDVKVHDSGDDESAGSRPDDSKLPD